MVSSCSENHTEHKVIGKKVTLNGLIDEYAVLEITVPEEFEYHHDDGVDFRVHRISSDSDQYNIGVYIGMNPSLFIEEPYKQVPGKIGSHETNWSFKHSEDGYCAETIVDSFLYPKRDYKGIFKPNPSKIHVFVSAPTESELHKLIAHCKTLNLIQPELPQN